METNLNALVMHQFEIDRIPDLIVDHPLLHKNKKKHQRQLSEFQNIKQSTTDIL